MTYDVSLQELLEKSSRGEGRKAAATAAFLDSTNARDAQSSGGLAAGALTAPNKPKQASSIETNEVCVDGHLRILADSPDSNSNLGACPAQQPSAFTTDAPSTSPDDSSSPKRSKRHKPGSPNSKKPQPASEADNTNVPEHVLHSAAYELRTSTLDESAFKNAPRSRFVVRVTQQVKADKLCIRYRVRGHNGTYLSLSNGKPGSGCSYQQYIVALARARALGEILGRRVIYSAQLRETMHETFSKSWNQVVADVEKVKGKETRSWLKSLPRNQRKTIASDSFHDEVMSATGTLWTDKELEDWKEDGEDDEKEKLLNEKLLSEGRKKGREEYHGVRPVDAGKFQWELFGNGSIITTGRYSSLNAAVVAREEFIELLYEIDCDDVLFNFSEGGSGSNIWLRNIPLPPVTAAEAREIAQRTESKFEEAFTFVETQKGRLEDLCARNSRPALSDAQQPSLQSVRVVQEADGHVHDASKKSKQTQQKKEIGKIGTMPPGMAQRILPLSTGSEYFVLDNSCMCCGFLTSETANKLCEKENSKCPAWLYIPRQPMEFPNGSSDITKSAKIGMSAAKAENPAMWTSAMEQATNIATLRCVLERINAWRTYYPEARSAGFDLYLCFSRGHAVESAAREYACKAAGLDHNKFVVLEKNTRKGERKYALREHLALDGEKAASQHAAFVSACKRYLEQQPNVAFIGNFKVPGPSDISHGSAHARMSTVRECVRESTDWQGNHFKLRDDITHYL